MNRYWAQALVMGTTLVVASTLAAPAHAQKKPATGRGQGESLRSVDPSDPAVIQRISQINRDRVRRDVSALLQRVRWLLSQGREMPSDVLLKQIAVLRNHLDTVRSNHFVLLGEEQNRTLAEPVFRASEALIASGAAREREERAASPQDRDLAAQQRQTNWELAESLTALAVAALAREP